MANEECRIEDYILPECNDRGKSFSICFRIPPALWDEVNRLSRDGQFPFETRQALFRWAFYRGIRSLASIKDKPQIPVLELPFLAFQTQWPAADQTFFTKLRGMVLQLKALGYSPQRLRTFAKAIEALIESLPDSHHPRTYLVLAQRMWASLSISTADERGGRLGFWT